MTLSEPSRADLELPPVAISLAEEHATIREWLVRLEEFRAQVDEGVAERVRADYLTRLDRIRRELEPHLDALRHYSAALHGTQEVADRAYLAARNTLDEARLRYLTSETAETEWVERAPALEAELERAESERDRIEVEVERWSGIFASVTEAEAETLSVSQPPAVVAQSPTTLPPDEEDDELPWLDIIDVEPVPSRPPPNSDTGLDFLSWMGDSDMKAPPQPQGAADDELAFLAELDRSLAAHTAGAENGGKGVSPQAADRQVTCRGCGSPHSQSAIFCDLCGADLP